jgi:hypothetical protein
MEIEVFSLCDAATGDSGKLNILGAFDSIFVRKLPAIHSQCSIALRLRYRRSEEGTHEVNVNIVDEDGKHIVPPLKGKMELRMRSNVSSSSANLILSLNGLKFDKAGEYSIDLLIDGEQRGSLPMFVNMVR